MSWQPAEIDTSGPPLRLNAAHQRPGYPGSSFIYLVYKNKPHLKYMNEQFLGRRTLKMASYDGRINFFYLLATLTLFAFSYKCWYFELKNDDKACMRIFMVTCIKWIPLKWSDVHLNTLEDFRPFESLLFLQLFNLNTFRNTHYLIFVLFYSF